MAAWSRCGTRTGSTSRATMFYLADGADGLAIIDIEKAELFTANGAINDARAVQIGSIAASMFALVARWQERPARGCS